MIPNLRCLVSILVFVGLPTAAHAGAWPQSPGATYAKLSVSTFSTTRFHTSEGQRLDTSEYSQLRLDGYLEAGITARLTGVLRLPIVERASFETSETHTAPGDLTLEARYAVRTGASPIALGLRVELPTGDSEGITPLRNTDGFVRLPTGDNETTLEPVLTVSHSFYPVPAYITGDAGYAFRGNGFTDAYRGHLEAGWRPAARILIRGTLDTFGPVTTPNRQLSLDASNGRGEGVQFTRLGGGIGYDPAPGLTVMLEIATSVWRTANAYGGTLFTLGMSWQRP